MLRLVGQCAVNLIGEDIQIMVHAEFCDRLEILARHDRSCRIVRERQNQDLRLRRVSGLEFLECQLELIFFLHLDNHRHAACQNRTRFIGNVARLRNDDLISRIEHRTQRDIDRLGAADRNHDLLVRIVDDIVQFVLLQRDLIAQRLQTGIGRVESTSLFQRIDAFLADVPRRLKVRLADAQRNDLRIIHLSHEIEIFPDAGRLDIDNRFRQWISHGVISCLSLLFSLTMTVP